MSILETHYDQAVRLIVNTLRKLNVPASDHEDIAHEVLKDILKMLNAGKVSFATPAHFFAFVKIRTSWRGHDLLRRRRRELPINVPDLMGRADEAPPVSQCVEDKKWGELCWRLLGELPPDDRRVLVLRYVEDLGFRDIATLLDVSEGAVKMRAKRALTKLRKLFDLYV